ncbi:MAG: PAS domain-containing protein, partial [Acidimicrobiia bacterium]|nr:PAS domain-containing protein [Acidimicrobiia bacterium]
MTSPQEQATRELLSRHPIAVDCALAAGSAARSAAEVVVFEAGRAFVVASTEAEVLQPRHLLAVEEQLLSEGARVATDGDAAAFAIVGHAGGTLGSLTLLDTSGTVNGDTYHALARVVSTVAADATRLVADQSLEAAVLDGLRDAVVVLGADMTIEWANRAVGSLIGRSPADMIGRSALDLLHPDDLGSALDAMTRLSEGLSITRAFVRLERGNGGYERVEVTGSDHSSHPTLGGMVLSLRAAEVEEELEASVDRVMRMSDAIVTGLLDGIVATDEFGAITMVNGVAREMFGLDPYAPPSQLELGDFTFLDHDGRPISPDLQPALANLDDEPREVCVMSARGQMRYVSTHQRPVHDDQGELLGSVLVFHDITQARRAADELRSQALHDQLTGLANRRQLEDRLGDLMAAETPHLVAACFIDLDGFKLVNDTHGHR